MFASVRRTLTARLCAVCLVALAISPFTAPFASCDLDQLADASSQAPNGNHKVHDDALLKFKTATKPLLMVAAAADPLFALPGGVAHRPIDLANLPASRPVHHRILRL